MSVKNIESYSNKKNSVIKDTSKLSFKLIFQRDIPNLMFIACKLLTTSYAGQCIITIPTYQLKHVYNSSFIYR